MSGIELTSTTDLTKFTVVQLRELLKSRALPSSGTKVELIERLKENLAAEEKILEADDSLTKDDSIERAPISADAIVTEDDVLGPDPASQKKADDEGGESDTTTTTKTSDKVDGKDEVSVKQGQQAKKADDAATAMETLDAKTKRALRFGLPLSGDDLKRKRAERFGLKVETEPDDEKKRRRLERFGLLNGTAKGDGGSAVNQDDILKKRAERFGLPVKDKESAKNGSSAANVSLSTDVVEKASLEALERRAKRFGVCSEQAEEFGHLKSDLNWFLE
ncbi:unnamed protein product [Anisakis simplex]|uniref:SAP domain-containing protein n=1 Tax=Anisakis simplex TaxID=6269 RepID=A0A0M3K1W3_ANISI|nr:unnamed protein product [Anisakis simplex]